jgi:TRAP-type C4-dicarboxylate transport system permease small subunit
MNRVISAIVLLAGLALVGYGYHASESVTSQTSQALTGTPTDKAMWLMVGGGIVALIGLAGLFRGPRTHIAA